MRARRCSDDGAATEKTSHSRGTSESFRRGFAASTIAITSEVEIVREIIPTDNKSIVNELHS